jgi:hypothetical protein
MREIGNVCRSLVEKSLGKCLRGKLQTSWINNTKVGLYEIGCEKGRWLEVAQYYVCW